MIASVDRILAEARAEEALEAWEEFDRLLKLARTSLPHGTPRSDVWKARAHVDILLDIAGRQIKAAKAALGMETAPRFEVTYCSQCGGTFGPGDHGFSHCENHSEIARLF